MVLIVVIRIDNSLIEGDDMEKKLPRAELELKRADGTKSKVYLTTVLKDVGGGSTSFAVHLYDENNNQVGTVCGTLGMPKAKLLLLQAPREYLQNESRFAFISLLSRYKVEASNLTGVGSELLRAAFDLCKLNGFDHPLVNAGGLTGEPNPLPFYEKVPTLLRGNGTIGISTSSKGIESPWVQYNLQGFNPNNDPLYKKIKDVLVPNP